MAFLKAPQRLGAAALLALATGAAAAPYLLRDISPELADIEPQVVSETAVAGGTLVFTVSPGGASTLWRSDGTREGTFPLHARRSEDDEAIVTVMDGIVFFTHDAGADLELWKTDGTLAGTARLATLVRGSRRHVDEFLDLDGRVFLAACSYTCTLWVSDGTRAGTTPLTDFRPRFDDDSEPQFGLGVRDGMCLLGVTTPDRQHEVWQTDGTPIGTIRVTDADDLFWPPYRCVPGGIRDGYGEDTGHEPSAAFSSRVSRASGCISR
jgi:ELWxxDGT repeat protein